MANHFKCSVCDLKRDSCSFFCADCIKEGRFSSSDENDKTFARQKERLYSLEEEQNVINDKLSRLLDERKKLEEFENIIMEYEFNIANLQKAIKKGRDAIACQEKLVNKLLLREAKLRRFRDNSKEGIIIAQKKINDVRQQIKVVNEQHKKVIENVKLVAKEKINQLKDYIFPVTSYPWPDDQNDFPSLVDTENTPLLGTFEPESMSSWSNIHYNRTSYVVVESRIPNDDITVEYNKWYSNNQQNMNISSSEIKTRNNDTYRVGAALAYIAQVLNIASYFLDIRYPKKLNFSEFYSRCSESGVELLLKNQELLHKVAKLNVNLFYLCLSQKIEPYLLHPRKTIKNLVLFLDTEIGGVGCIEPVEVDMATYKLLKECLLEDYSLMEEPNLLECIGNDSQEDDILDSEWESVTHTGPLFDHSPSLQPGTSGGIVSSIVTSLASATSYFRKK